MPSAIIIVDHGSRSPESNKLLLDLVTRFRLRFMGRYSIVEPAHMELEGPSIAAAYTRCVERGATSIVVCPFFLGPGRHSQIDIPRLATEAAAPYPQTSYVVADPLGFDDLMLQLLDKRIGQCLQISRSENVQWAD